jgi:hypothetical protein
MFGYAGSPEARRTSAILDAVLGGVLAGVGRPGMKAMFGPSGAPLTRGTAWKEVARRTAPITGFLAAETIPIAQAGLHKQRETAAEIGTAAQELARAGIPASLRRALTSPTARGAGVGAAGAGLAAILSGLMRRRSEREMKARTTRGRMIGKDFLKYLIPAMVAGGVAGSFVPKAQQQ